MGIYELREAARGTIGVAKLILEANPAFAVIGGGDSTAATREVIAGGDRKTTQKIFLSTGGGSFMQGFRQRALPGFDALAE